MLTSAKYLLAQGLKIAIRYSIVRRQFKIKDKETQLIDFQTQQYKLFPLVANMFAIAISGSKVMDIYRQMLKGIEKQDFSLLELLHHFCSGMKAVYT